jgi:AbrB family looped-hinge helix DNA binding protein
MKIASAEKAVVSEKGQVTIPKRIREQLGIRPGQVLEFRENQGQMVVVKQSAEDRVTKVYGILKLKRRTDDLINQLRGPNRST